VPASVFSGQRLSTDEAIELANQLAELAKAGLPLPDGLRAMADELPRRFLRRNRLASTLRTMADQLAAGQSLESTVQSQVSRLPATMQGLLLAGIRSGHLGEVLEEFVAVQREQIELRNRVKRILAYPAFLLMIVLGLLLFFGLVTTPAFQRMYDDFQIELPVLTRVAMSVGSTVGIVVTALLAGAVGFFLLQALLRFEWGERVFDKLPVIGPLWRWSRMTAFARLMALLLKQEVRLPDALRLAAEGVGSPNLTLACEGMAREVEAGQSPATALAHFRQLPATLEPLIDWALHTNSLNEAFEAAAEVFEARTRINTLFMEALLPPVLFMMIGVAVGVAVMALFLPLHSLIAKLT
jgi:type II secretory pathway component PulF